MLKNGLKKISKDKILIYKGIPVGYQIKKQNQYNLLILLNINGGGDRSRTLIFPMISYD
jgi:hypothetical protein